MSPSLLDQFALGQVLLALLFGWLIHRLIKLALVNDLADLEFSLANDENLIAWLALSANHVATLVAFSGQTEMQSL